MKVEEDGFLFIGCAISLNYVEVFPATRRLYKILCLLCIRVKHLCFVKIFSMEYQKKISSSHHASGLNYKVTVTEIKSFSFSS